MMGAMLRSAATAMVLVLACQGAFAAEPAGKHKQPAAKAHAAAPAKAQPAQSAQPELNMDELKAKAAAGDASAQVKLGEALHEGRGIARDEAAAAEWFRKAADQGSPQGLAALATLYVSGRGVAADPAKAAELMRQAAEKGSVPASYSLGIMYLRGQGVTADRAQALSWLRKAADAKHAPAQYALGLLNVSRDAPSQDGAEAVKWLSLAATHGDAEMRTKALEKIKVISQAIGQDKTQEGLEAARVWLYSHS